MSAVLPADRARSAATLSYSAITPEYPPVDLAQAIFGEPSSATPQPSASASSQPSASPAPQAPAAPRRRRQGVVVLIIVAVILLLGLVTTGAVVASRALGGTRDLDLSSPAVESLREEPAVAWTYAYRTSGQRGDGAPTIDAVVPMPDGNIAVLVVPNLSEGESRVDMIDGETGEVLWSQPFERLGLREGYQARLLAPSPEGHLTVAVEGFTDATPLQLVSIRPEDGGIVSTAELEGASLRRAAGDSVALGIPTTAWQDRVVDKALVVVTDDGLRRLDTGDLDGDPVWSAAIPGADRVAVDRDYVQFSVGETQWWLDADTGFEPAWFDGDSAGASAGGSGSVSYWPVFEDMVLRVDLVDREDGEGEYVLDALAPDGTTLWRETAATVLSAETADGSELFVADREADGDQRGLRRLDPATGEDLWGHEYDEAFGTMAPRVVAGDVSIAAADGIGGTALLDASTGQVAHRIPGVPVLFADDLVYMEDGDELSAWDVDTGVRLWSLTLDDGVFPASIGTAVMLVDPVHGTMERLR
ncbi:outer membrane protein assembly factor BamB family protein [Brachybacterium sp. DNPG3]